MSTGDGTEGVATSTRGEPRTEIIIPTIGGIEKTTKHIAALRGFWSDRNAAFDKYQKLVDLEDEQEQTGLESMVGNNARTLFSLARFMVSTSRPQRTIAVGDQGPAARRKAGKAERAVASWWTSVDERRLWRGDAPWQHAMAWWMCLYGWYATLALVAVDADNEPVFVADAYDPSECFPQFGGDKGWKSFVRSYRTTLEDAIAIASNNGVYESGKFSGDPLQEVQVHEYWERTPFDEVVHSILLESNSLMYLKQPTLVTGLSRIPILCGPCGGTPSRSKPGWQSAVGSVLDENAVVYRDFNKWMSFLAQMAKEHALAPIISKNLHLDDEEINPSDIRAGRAIVETDDPEADARRLDVGPAPIDIWRLVGLIQGMEQRGGFPESAYGNLMIELSGFGISQLLQAAERRVGDQVTILGLLDGRISRDWLDIYRDNEFEATQIAGFMNGNPRKSFIEEFKPSDVPKKYRLSTNIPVRIGNDMMSKMAIARQAVGGQQQLLDVFTAIDEILGMQDPALILDRIGEDQARGLTDQLKLVLNLKLQAEDLRASRKPKAVQVAALLDQFAEQMLQQQQGAQGAQPRQRIAPEQLPPEARGQSPDRVRAMMRMGPPPNMTAEEQAAGGVVA